MNQSILQEKEKFEQLKQTKKEIENQINQTVLNLLEFNNNVFNSLKIFSEELNELADFCRKENLLLPSPFTLTEEPVVIICNHYNTINNQNSYFVISERNQDFKFSTMKLKDFNNLTDEHGVLTNETYYLYNNLRDFKEKIESVVLKTYQERNKEFSEGIAADIEYFNKLKAMEYAKEINNLNLFKIIVEEASRRNIDYNSLPSSYTIHINNMDILWTLKKNSFAINVKNNNGTLSLATEAGKGYSLKINDKMYQFDAGKDISVDIIADNNYEIPEIVKDFLEEYEHILDPILSMVDKLEVNTSEIEQDNRGFLERE